MTRAAPPARQPSRAAHSPRERLLATKTRLQFTGWLQYLLPTLLAALLGLVALASALLSAALGGSPLLAAAVPLGLAALLLLRTAFDVVTLKGGLRPREPLPRSLTRLDVFDLLRARRSCRSFQTRDLSDAHRDALVTDAATWARPEAVLGDSPIRFEYVAAPLTVWPVVGAHEFLVAIAPAQYDRAAVVDVGRSLHHVVMAATRRGVSTCWIGPGAHHASLLARMGDRFDPAQDHVVCVCAIGYASRLRPLLIPAIQWLQHRRLPLTRLFFRDAAFSAPIVEHDPLAVPFGRTLEGCQWSPSSFNGQTTRAAIVPAVDPAGERVARVDFATATESRFYAPVALGIWLANWELGCAARGFRGHFRRLDAAERGVPDPPALPRYEISWLPSDLVPVRPVSR